MQLSFKQFIFLNYFSYYCLRLLQSGWNSQLLWSPFHRHSRVGHAPTPLFHLTCVAKKRKTTKLHISFFSFFFFSPGQISGDFYSLFQVSTTKEFQRRIYLFCFVFLLQTECTVTAFRATLVVKFSSVISTRCQTGCCTS